MSVLISELALAVLRAAGVEDRDIRAAGDAARAYSDAEAAARDGWTPERSNALLAAEDGLDRAAARLSRGLRVDVSMSSIVKDRLRVAMLHDGHVTLWIDDDVVSMRGVAIGVDGGRASGRRLGDLVRDPILGDAADLVVVDAYMEDDRQAFRVEAGWTDVNHIASAS